MPIPVISTGQMRDWEQASWAAGVSQEAVIRQAGGAVASWAMVITQPEDPILVLAGRGHNGDDARQAGEQLVDRKVTVVEVRDPADALSSLSATLHDNPTTLPTLIIDGLFGIGINRPLSTEWIALVEWVNQAGLPILAVDVPSGLDAETGQVMGAAIQATVTVTLGAPKRGLLQTDALDYVGRLEVAPDIGLLPCPIASEIQWTMPGDFASFPPRRPVNGHKGSFGHLAIIAGSAGYHGAAVLTARGAQRAQPGLITLLTTPETYIPVASQLASVMVHPWRNDSALPNSNSAIVAGPGLAASELPLDLKQWVRDLWSHSPLPMLVDASALEWLPESSKINAIRVITPHPGEAGRMLGCTTAQVQSDRPVALRELSRRWGNCHVVLKGCQTLIGCEAGPVFVNPSGNPHLAQGGAGDVLAGFLGGLIAQPALQKDMIKTLCYGVWLHGATADALNRKSIHWSTEDLASVLGDI